MTGRTPGQMIDDALCPDAQWPTLEDTEEEEGLLGPLAVRFSLSAAAAPVAAAG